MVVFDSRDFGSDFDDSQAVVWLLCVKRKGKVEIYHFRFIGILNTFCQLNIHETTVYV